MALYISHKCLHGLQTARSWQKRHIRGWKFYETVSGITFEDNWGGLLAILYSLAQREEKWCPHFSAAVLILISLYVYFAGFLAFITTWFCYVIFVALVSKLYTWTFWWASVNSPGLVNPNCNMTHDFNSVGFPFLPSAAIDLSLLGVEKWPVYTVGRVYVGG